jgi:hypothetical protein
MGDKWPPKQQLIIIGRAERVSKQAELSKLDIEEFIAY